jgi:transcriptional regulator with XRE-family HTH domain
LLGATLCHMDTRTRLDVRTIGKRVADRRIELHLEQEDLADRAGLSRAYISRLENGIVKNPKVFDLEQVALALGLPLTALVGPEDGGQEIRIAECADILAELDGEPPEVINGVMTMLRTSVAIRKARRLARDN